MIDEVDRRLIQLEMEKLSLRKETRRDAIQRVEQIDGEMGELKLKQVQWPTQRPRVFFAIVNRVISLVHRFLADAISCPRRPTHGREYE